MHGKLGKAFQTRGYYVETVDNITDEAIYIYRDKLGNHVKRIQEVPLYKQTNNSV